MKKVFIIHGFQGRPNTNWFPWLMEELSKEKIYACALPMPTPYEPVKREWVEIMNFIIKEPDEEVFLVGHSLGVLAILLYLQTLNIKSKIGGAVLVSGPITKIEKEDHNLVNNFMSQDFDFNYLKSVCQNFTIIHGDNDPDVPFSDALYLKEKLGANLISIKDGGHLNGLAGFYKLPAALEAVTAMM